jgi:predicted pyridoxine 5'-phosphate oxidase superfamily flavin-nucleotide-binding protein
MFVCFSCKEQIDYFKYLVCLLRCSVMKNFTEIAFTDDVKTIQTKFGSRKNYVTMEQKAAPTKLPDEAKGFIEESDLFYQATVGTNGWPYVQHRGGPKGMLKVLSGNKIGYADFRGNKQYLSVGNIQSNNKVSIIIMDYPRKSRLKIWATAEIVTKADAPELVEQLQNSEYKASIERAVILTVEAFDWNCPQHIKPRFTEPEIAEWFAPYQQKMSELEDEIKMLKARLDE